MWPFIWINLNLLHPRMLCAKFGWNWPSGSGEILNIILHSRYYLPLEQGVALYLNKLDSPSSKDALCQVRLKLTQWFWRRSWKCEKFTDGQMDGQTDDRWSEKLTWAFSLGELKIAHLVINQSSHFQWLFLDKYIWFLLEVISHCMLSWEVDYIGVAL